MWPAFGSPGRLALWGRLPGKPNATVLVPAMFQARRSAHSSCLLFGVGLGALAPKLAAWAVVAGGRS